MGNQSLLSVAVTLKPSLSTCSLWGCSEGLVTTVYHCQVSQSVSYYRDIEKLSVKTMSSSGALIIVLWLGLSLVENTHGECRTDKKERCIFPFIFHGITFNSCTQAESDRYWCATEVRASGQAFNTGWCESNCPTDELPFSSTGGAKPSRSSPIAATQSFRNSGRRCSNTYVI